MQKSKQPRHQWSKTGSTREADFFTCCKCGLHRKQYAIFNERVVSYSKDGLTYTITGTAHPFPVCVQK